MGLKVVVRAVPLLVALVETKTEDVGRLQEAVHNAAKILSPAAVVSARALQIPLAGFLTLCGPSTGQRGRSILWLVSSMGKPRVNGAQRGAPIRPGSPLRLGRGVCRRARQKKGLCAGVVAALQVATARPKKWLRPNT